MRAPYLRRFRAHAQKRTHNKDGTHGCRRIAITDESHGTRCKQRFPGFAEEAPVLLLIDPEAPAFLHSQFQRGLELVLPILMKSKDQKHESMKECRIDSMCRYRYIKALVRQLLLNNLLLRKVQTPTRFFAEDRGSALGAVYLTRLVDFYFRPHTNLYNIKSTKRQLDRIKPNYN
jgi:hypothetical protein